MFGMTPKKNVCIVYRDGERVDFWRGTSTDVVEATAQAAYRTKYEHRHSVVELVVIDANKQVVSHWHARFVRYNPATGEVKLGLKSPSSSDEIDQEIIALLEREDSKHFSIYVNNKPVETIKGSDDVTLKEVLRKAADYKNKNPRATVGAVLLDSEGHTYWHQHVRFTKWVEETGEYWFHGVNPESPSDDDFAIATRVIKRRQEREEREEQARQQARKIHQVEEEERARMRAQYDERLRYEHIAAQREAEVRRHQETVDIFARCTGYRSPQPDFVIERDPRTGREYFYDNRRR
jgi:hypothetical protein